MASITFGASPGNYSVGASWIGAAAPGVGDDALIVLASGTPTIDAGAVSRSIDFNTFTGTTVGTANTLTLGDATAGAGNRALRFVAAMTVTAFPITFVSTSATVQTVDFAGKTTGNVTFNAASNGNWQYVGGHTIGTAGTLTLTQGTLDLNGQTISWGIFNTSNANIRSLTLGAANLTITGSSTTVWNGDNAGNLTFSGASSTITFTGGGITFNPNGQTFGTLIFNGGTTVFNRNFTVATLTKTGTASKTDFLTVGGASATSPTVTAALNINGNSTINRIIVQSPTVGTARTITTTGATVTATNTDFMDITLSTTKDFSGQTDIGDAGGNSGITFPASVSQTATGTASFTWSTHGFTTRVPLPQDDVSIPNAFVAGRTITADMPRLGRDLIFNCTGSPTFTNTVVQSIYGSLDLTGVGAISGSNALTFSGRSNHTIKSAGVAFTQAINITAFGGTYTLQDAFTISGAGFTLNNGTFNTNGFTVSTVNYASAGSGVTKALNITNSTWNLTSTATSSIWSIGFASGMTFTGTGSTIVISAASANTRTFAGAGLTYGTLTYTVAGSTGQFNVTGSNTFSVINFFDITNARTLAFTAGTTTTITTANGFNIQGTAGKLMTAHGITAATWTLSSAFNQATDYVTYINCAFIGGGTFYAGSHSVDGGGNTGLTFTDPPFTPSGGSGAAGSALDLLFAPYSD